MMRRNTLGSKEVSKLTIQYVAALGTLIEIKVVVHGASHQPKGMLSHESPDRTPGVAASGARRRVR